MKDELNYDCIIFDKDCNQIKEFEFCGENAALANDHAAHVLRCEDEGKFLKYKKKGNMNWKTIEKKETSLGDMIIAVEGFTQPIY